MLCVVASAICSAQQSNRPLTPSEIVDRFLKAQQAQEWAEAASYLDLDALERIRQREVESYSDARFPKWTVEQFMKEDPSMPRAVAEYQVQRMRTMERDFDTRRMWSFEFADIDSFNDLKKLKADELAVRWAKAHDLAYRSRQNVARCKHVPAEDASALAEQALHKRSYRILGEIISDSMAYVLKEDEFDGKPENPLLDVGIILPPENFILRKTAATWKLLPFVGRVGTVMSIECAPEPTSTPPKK